MIQIISDKYGIDQDDLIFDSHKIFNGNFKIDELNLKNNKTLLTLGHYYAYAKNDIRQAKYYYDCVTNMNSIDSTNSTDGIHSLANYYYRNKQYDRAKKYLLEIHESTFCKMRSIVLLHKIYKIENNMSMAESLLLENIDNNNIDKLLIFEELCSFYFNNKQEQEFLNYASFINHSNKIRGLLCKYYLDKEQFVKLFEHATFLEEKKLAMGYYFLGQYYYKLFASLCKSEHGLKNSIVEAYSHIDTSIKYFMLGSESSYSNDKLICDACKSLKIKLDDYHAQITNAIINADFDSLKIN
jgi:hypothetical protein